LTETLGNRQKLALSKPALPVQQSLPNLADSVKKYETYQFQKESTKVVLPPRQALDNELLPPPVPTSSNLPLLQSPQATESSTLPALTINTDPQIIGTSIKQIKFEQLEQQLAELNRDLLEDIRKLMAQPVKGDKSVFFKYSTNFYYVV
jgi:hypothetical protein